MIRRLAAGSLCLVLWCVGWVGFHRSIPERSTGTLGGDDPIPYIRLTPPTGRSPRGTALVVHGLDSNKEFMQILAMSVADGGFDTWTIDLPGHGDSPGTFSWEASLQAVRKALAAMPEDTLVIGHSLGAALLAETGMTRQLGKTVLLSPPPMALSQVRAEPLLIVSGRFDAPRIDNFIPALREQAGGDSQWWRLPWAGHSSALFNPRTLDRIVAWIDGETPTRTAERIGWLCLMAVGGLVLPAGWIFSSQLRKGLPDSQIRTGRGALDLPGEIASYVAALGASLLLLTWFNPLGWLNLFRTDYFMSLLGLSGLALWRGRGPGLSFGGALRGTGAAALVILVIVATGSSVMHLIPSGQQWFRLPFLILAGLPLFLHEENQFRGLAPWWRRWGMFLLAIALIWAAVLTGVLLFSPGSVFLVLIAHFILLGRIPLWWLAGLVRRGTNEPGAAALFSAIVQGWVFAALFVTI